MNKADSKTAQSVDSDSNQVARNINGVAISRYAVFLLLGVGGCAVDLLTKHMLFGKHFPKFREAREMHLEIDPVWWIDGWLGLEPSTNLGALFGAGQGLQGLFALLSIIAFVSIVVWLFAFRSAKSWTITIALGLITGGIFGNLYDRMGFWHDADMSEQHAYGVRDWIHFRWENAPGFLQSTFNPWPNFNIADSVLVCGAILLVVHAFFLQPKEKNDDEESDDDSDGAK